MWILLQSIIGLVSLVASFAFAIKAILQYKPSLKKILQANFDSDPDSPTLAPNKDQNRYILRKKDYETYQSIKYGAGVKTAAMCGPNLILIDLELIKAFNQRDFNYFPDRHPPFYHPDSTMNKMLSFATGEEWKRLKSILTQAFSTSRIRRVQESLHESSMKLVDFIRAQLSNSKDPNQLEIVGPLNKYLLELIASSVFGLEDTAAIWESNDSPFEVYTKEVQKAMIRHRQARGVPGLLRLAKLFNLIRVDPKALKFFKSIISSSIQMRMEEDNKSDDVLQLLMEASSSTDSKVRLTEEMILSQAFMFFFAGTEGPATLMIYGLYELAMNPNVQQKLYEEVAGATETSTGAYLDYDIITKLPYLDMFVCEVLRMYSSSVTSRRCVQTYKVPNTGLVIQPGTPVHTPIYGIHHDQEYYPNPFKFNPDNFTAEAKAKRPSGAYQPFGIGPRSCIAQKFGLVQGKSAICSLVYNFRVSSTWKTQSPPRGSIESMFLPEDGLWLQFEDRIK